MKIRDGAWWHIELEENEQEDSEGWTDIMISTNDEDTVFLILKEREKWEDVFVYEQCYEDNGRYQTWPKILEKSNQVSAERYGDQDFIINFKKQ